MMRTSLILYLAIPFGLAVPARAIFYTFQTVIDPADSNFTQLPGVNNSGVIAGYFGDGAAVFNNGVFTVLNFPGSNFTQALGLNNNGLIVGSYVDNMNNMHGFLYNTVTGTYQSIDDPHGAGETTINGINDLDELVGFYATGTVTQNGIAVTVTDGFVGTATPEPGSLVLVGLGLLALGLFDRRRRR
jgi:hypothetical protein